MRRFVHLPVVGRFAQRAFLSKLEDIAVMALAFCHSHEITLRDLETYGVLQVTSVLHLIPALQPVIGVFDWLLNAPPTLLCARHTPKGLRYRDFSKIRPQQELAHFELVSELPRWN